MTAPLTVAVAAIVILFKRDPPRKLWDAAATIAAILAIAGLVSVVLGMGPAIVMSARAAQGPGGFPLWRIGPYAVSLLAFWWAWLFIAEYFEAFGLWRLALSVIIGISFGMQWLKLAPKSEQAAQIRA